MIQELLSRTHAVTFADMIGPEGSVAEVPLASVNDGAELSVISVVVEEALRRIHYTLPVDDLVDGGRRNRIRIRLTSEAEPVRVEAVKIRILPV